MIIADLLNISINLVFVAQITVSLLLLGIVLMQRPKNEGLGAAFGAALTDQAFGARTTDVLQKGTVYLGTLFIGLSFALTLLIVHRSDSEKSKLLSAPKETVAEQVQKDVPAKTQAELLKEIEQKSGAQTPAKEAEAPAKESVPVTPLTPATESVPAKETAPAPAK